jgi:ABC-type polysaccharide/polyol phosphate export permease
MFWYFFKREIFDNYKNNLTGLSWVFIQPIILLIIYTFVFEVIFKAKVPEASSVGFTVYLAIGLWPWLAFSESLIKSITVIDEKKDLVGKVSMDFKVLVIASISANYFLTMVGYIIVLLTLMLIGKQFNYINILLIIIPVALLYILSIALGLLLSSIQVFIKDIKNFASTFILIWFYLTPIIYSKSIVPPQYIHYLDFNPIYIPIDFLHSTLLLDQEIKWIELGIVTVVYLVILKYSAKLFDKLSPRFVDFI